MWSDFVIVFTPFLHFRDWLVRFVEKSTDSPRDRLLALFDAHGEWFAEESFRGCLFINAAAEFSGSSNSIQAVAAETKRLLNSFIRDLAVAAGAKNPDVLADQISLLMEGAIVCAQVLGDGGWAQKAREAAEILIDNNSG